MGATLAFCGRLLLASLFLLSGAMKLAQHEDGRQGPIVAYMAPKMNNALERVEQLTGQRVPLQQEMYPLLVLGAGCIELLGAVLFTLNLKFGALLLIIFIIPTTAIMHNFWDMEPHSPAHQIEYINFMKNICLLGAFLMFLNMPRVVVTPKFKAL